MWTFRIFREVSFLLVQNIWHEQHWKPFDSMLEWTHLHLWKILTGLFLCQGLFYFPKSVKVGFSICCLAQGCLTGSKEVETGAGVEFPPHSYGNRQDLLWPVYFVQYKLAFLKDSQEFGSQNIQRNIVEDKNIRSFLCRRNMDLTPCSYKYIYLSYKS